MSRKGQSHRQKREERILAEVRERVIRESMNLEEEKSIGRAREAELEALKEISDLYDNAKLLLYLPFLLIYITERRSPWISVMRIPMLQ